MTRRDSTRSTDIPKTGCRRGPAPRIDGAACTGCGLCLAVCPSGAIGRRGGERGWLPFIDERRCLRCDLCVAVCPQQAAEVAFEIVALER